MSICTPALVALAAGLMVSGLAPRADAATLDFIATSAHRAARAIFEVDPGNSANLIVTLRNTSAADALVPVDVLTAVFFDITDPAVSLTRVSAVLGGGSVVHFGGTDPGNVVGGEWAYLGSLAGGGPESTDYGISSTGLGLFGPGDRFPGTDLQSPASPNGLQYGIVSLADNVATGNTPVTGTNALIQDTVIFTLSGLPQGFDPMGRIRNVQFQYGTDLSEPHFPTPGAASLVALAGLLSFRRSRA